MLEFRFLHASDLHLEQPLYGLSEAPEHLRDLLIDAPLQAAESVFEAALVEQVDFVVLSGDVIQAETAGPRAIAFLLEQFKRLDEHDIDVYWVGGQVDPPDRWPAAAPLPPNVHTFPQTHVEEITHYRGEQPLAVILGQSWVPDRQFRAGDYQATAPDLFSIAAIHGRLDPEPLAKEKVHYWALGGRHDRKKFSIPPRTAVYPGTTQGRCPVEFGPAGCVLVQVDAARNAKLKPIANDVVRWRSEKITVDPKVALKDLQKLMAKRIDAARAEGEGRPLFISWQIEGAAHLGSQMREGGLAEQLVGALQNDFGHRKPVVWPVSMRIEPPATFPEKWYEEDTIMGDFLRAIRARQLPGAAPLDFDNFLSDENASAALTSAVAINDPVAQQRVLREAAALAVDMLRGEQKEAPATK